MEKYEYIGEDLGDFIKKGDLVEVKESYWDEEFGLVYVVEVRPSVEITLSANEFK